MSDSCLLDFNGILEPFSPLILPHVESLRSQGEAEACLSPSYRALMPHRTYP